jgi:hypothetical protein
MMKSKVSPSPIGVAAHGTASDNGRNTDPRALALPASTASAARDALSVASSSANAANLSLTSSARDIRPNPEKLIRFKQELAHHAALDNWIRIDNAQAFGVLEQGRFESRFAPLARVSVAPDASPLRNQETNNLPEKHHRAAVSEDSEDAEAEGKGKDVAMTHTPIGWRANLLAYDRTAILVSSAAMFASIRQPTLLISLDRMTRTMHSINFFASPVSGLLFLPVHEGLLLNVRHDHGQYFAALLLSLRLNPARVVIEIPAFFAAKTTLLSQLIASYHRYGFKVALSLPESFDVAALPVTSKPEFLLTDADPDPKVSAPGTAHAVVRSAEAAALASLAKLALHYGATLVARPTERSV